MLHFLILVVETLLPLAVPAGMLLGYAGRRELFEVRKPAERGAALGALIAAVLAALKTGTGFVVREYYDLALLAVIIPAEMLLLVTLFRGRSIPAEKAATPLLQGLVLVLAASWVAYCLPDIFIFPSRFAVGVVEVVSSEFIFIIAGYLTGLLLCLFTCRALYKACAAVPAKILLPMLFAVMAACLFRQLVTAGQMLLGRGLLPRYDPALDLIIFLLDKVRLIFFCIMGTAALPALFLLSRSGNVPVEGDNPAEKRKAKSRMIRRIRWSKAALASLLLGLLLMTAGVHFNNREVELSPPTATAATTEGLIRLPLSEVGDGALHRFVYSSRRGVDIRYIVIKKSESAYGVGLDACDVCGAGGGYYERKGQVICTLCDVVMNKSTIGFAGGCNPVPLPFRIESGSLLINIEDLEAEAPRFM
ncbi:MAG: DUF2318 domain-containing protein [Desulfovibrio sp.]|jgi:uncharacterized membrane protein|nr:DUF2318 domain-containing protein [Desulfovibrio sp.]